MSFQRLGALIRRETIQILRDRRFIMLVIGLTFIQLFIYSYAATKTIYHLPMAVADQSQDTKSREFVQALVNSQFFDVSTVVQSEAEVREAIAQGQVKVGLVIPPGFATQTDRGAADILFLLDGSDSFAVRSGYTAAGLVAQTYGLRLNAQAAAGAGVGAGSVLPITALTRTLYNPDLNDRWFVLPGIIGMILQTLAIEQAAIFVVRDRELGTIEQILATPARQLELVISKIVPLLGLCLLALGVSLGLSIAWFGVPFQGSLLLYLLMALLFISSCLAMGIFISTRANTQLEAEALSMMFMLLGMLLSGLFYPRQGMPLIPALIGDLAPLTYFIRISRAIYTKGVGLEFMWTDALALVIYLLVVVLVTARRFKTRLD